MALNACACGPPALLARSQSEADGTLPMAALGSDVKHALLEKADAIAKGYPVTLNNFCSYPFCPHAEANKKQKCGQGMQRQQEGRSKAPCFCIHPKCCKGFHATCHALAHKLLEARLHKPHTDAIQEAQADGGRAHLRPPALPRSPQNPVKHAVSSSGVQYCCRKTRCCSRF